MSMSYRSLWRTFATKGVDLRCGLAPRKQGKSYLIRLFREQQDRLATSKEVSINDNMICETFVGEDGKRIMFVSAAKSTPNEPEEH